MRLAMMIGLYGISLASVIMFEISESASWSHGWFVIAIGSAFAASARLPFQQIDRILSKIDQAAGLVGSGTDLPQIEQDLVILDRKARKMKQCVFIAFGAAVSMAGLAILGRWMRVSDKSVFRNDLLALFLLQAAIQCFFFSALQRRLIALCRRLMKPANEEESADNE